MLAKPETTPDLNDNMWYQVTQTDGTCGALLRIAELSLTDA